MVMVGQIALAIGVVCLILAALAFLSVISLAPAPLLIVGIIALVLGFFLYGGTNFRSRGRVR
jgi:hypothetical protein